MRLQSPNLDVFEASDSERLPFPFSVLSAEEVKARSFIVETYIFEFDQIAVDCEKDREAVHKLLRAREVDRESAAVAVKRERERQMHLRHRLLAEEDLERRVLEKVEDRVFRDLVGDHIRKCQKSMTLHNVSRRKTREMNATALAEQPRASSHTPLDMAAANASVAMMALVPDTLSPDATTSSSASPLRGLRRIEELRAALRRAPLKELQEALPTDLEVGAAALLQRVGRGYVARVFHGMRASRRRSPSRRVHALRLASPSTSAYLLRSHTQPHEDAAMPDAKLARLLAVVRKLRKVAYPGATKNDSLFLETGGPPEDVVAPTVTVQEPFTRPVRLYDPKEESDRQALLKAERLKRQHAIDQETWSHVNRSRIQEAERLAAFQKASAVVSQKALVQALRRQKARNLRKATDKKREHDQRRKKFMVQEQREVELLQLHIQLRQKYMHESRVEAMSQSMQQVPGAKLVASMSKSFSCRGSNSEGNCEGSSSVL